ncbi:hypothetical protein E2C01_016044 [Portunus trituberculatus]|uniref:Uncharacterized protein n=1 Tax=Portunus trituberculatus TaxID=210409 RepID=A0A5B7DNF0_PORTR|nr:hypothetical protein [Portunus trituberculatus]
MPLLTSALRFTQPSSQNNEHFLPTQSSYMPKKFSSNNGPFAKHIITPLPL